MCSINIFGQNIDKKIIDWKIYGKYLMYNIYELKFFQIQVNEKLGGWFFKLVSY